MDNRQDYFGGREHSAVKHHFLRQYLPSLAFKTLQAKGQIQPSFCYIDGFTGPWEASDQEYRDTSFGLALEVLNQVGARLPNVTLRAVFCETGAKAFKELESFVSANAGGVEARCFQGKFEDHIQEITAFAGKKDFIFAFIDPKGWNVDTRQITPLLKDRRSEVLFNFMAEFIGRFPSFENVRDSYAALLGASDWKDRFDDLPAELPSDEKVLILFREMLKERWGFSYTLDLPIKKPARNRVFYKLVYGTRSPHGVIAFRDAQAVAEREGYAIQSEARQLLQREIWGADEDARQIAASIGVGSSKHVMELRNAVNSFLDERPTVSYLPLCGAVMETIPVRELDVLKCLKDMSLRGLLTYTNKSRNGRPTRRSVIQRR